MENHLLSLMTFLPLLGAVAILFIPKREAGAVKAVAAAAAFLPLVLGVKLFCSFDRGMAGMQFVERHAWIPSFHVEYYFGVDGLSVPMVLLTALLSFLCIIASWKIETGVKGYFGLFLLLETGMMGAFCALDFFLFYVFWEIMLLPMYFLIALWGGPRREYAAIKFFLYTLLGSVLMLLVLLVLYFSSNVDGHHSFDLVRLADQATHTGWLRSSVTLPWVGTLSMASFRHLCFVLLFVGFAVKVPLFPFHTWLPDAHVEAPTAISVILAGVLLKMGTYGLMRISYPILPDAAGWFAPAMAALGVTNILYGALCAMAQSDLKKLVAYSSINHMGYVCLGLAAFTPMSLNGAALQMASHGIITAMLFLFVGVVYDRAHHRDINGFGGLASVTPIYAGMTALAFFASLGLPGFSGFIAEAVIFLGSWQNEAMHGFVILASLGIVLGAAFHLWAYQRVFLGKLNPKYANLEEVSGRELFTLVPLAVLAVIVGCFPSTVLDLITASLGQMHAAAIPYWPR